MGNALDKLTIKGFKSIKSLEDFELGKLNIMIGGNGAGKSNFVDLFRLLRAMMDENLATHIMTQGGCDEYLFDGPKCTTRIEILLKFKNYFKYSCSLLPTVDEKFIIEKEKFGAHEFFGGFESNLIEAKNDESSIERRDDEHLYQLISNFTVYHFHDTSSTAPMRRFEITADNMRLRPNASNIAPFLLELQKDKPKFYSEIVETVKLVTPFFDDFILKSKTKGEKETVNLSWKQKGSDYPMQPYHFSDGTIRFICLATSLLQPDPPSTIVIDEPELGLHPYAIEILAELIKAASKKMQVIVSTQSPPLIDNFSVEDIIVVTREKGASTFKRLKAEELSHWLEDYSLGDLWRKNIVAGGPTHE